MAKPSCGTQGGTTTGTPSGVIADLIAIGGIVGGLATIYAKVEGLVGLIEPLTILGVTGATAFWISAAVGAAIAFFVVFDFWRHRCLTDPDTRETCSSGVVNGIVESFSSTVEGFFPFAAMHDRVDVVVKSVYWPLVETNAVFVHCNDDPDSSPILRGYYKDPAVCAAGAGATVGAGIGAVGGILAGVAIAAAIGCATIILCLIAIIVAAIVAAVIVIAAAIIGGHVGRAIAEDATPSAGSTPLLIGNYVTTKGGLLTSEFDDGARVYWFVDETSLHGTSTGTAPFSFTDPDANLLTDACPVEAPIIG